MNDWSFDYALPIDGKIVGRLRTWDGIDHPEYIQFSISDHMVSEINRIAEIAREQEKSIAETNKKKLYKERGELLDRLAEIDEELSLE